MKQASKKILIIDDEPDVAAYMAMVLETSGYLSKTISNLNNSLDIVRQYEPDLICLDLMMPRETGISFYKRLRREKEFDQIPVMIVSGASPDGEFDFREYVADESISPPDFYMEKPIDITRFIEKVRQLTKSGTSAKADNR